MPPYEGDEPYIFVGYKREDWPRIRPLLEELIERGCRLWYDEGIESGERWDTVIRHKVRGSSRVLVFLSEAATRSKWVKRECKFADKDGKPFLPVVLEDFELPEDLEFLELEYQMLDVRKRGFSNKLRKSLEKHFPEADWAVREQRKPAAGGLVATVSRRVRVQPPREDNLTGDHSREGPSR